VDLTTAIPSAENEHIMEIGIDSFAASPLSSGISNAQAIRELLERMELADQVGLDVFGIGEHHRKEFLDSAPTLILAAAASRTKKIILTSAVTVLSAADPVRVFQNFATLDLISNGRAEIVAGRGSFTESYPLFGLNLHDYDALFTEKLDLLLQDELPIWVGVGGTPSSFVRAGRLGLPLMVAVIGGETHRFRPLIDSYREAGEKAGHSPEKLKVGLHSLGYVANSRQEAINDYYPGYAEMFTRIGKERGFPPVSRERFDAQNHESGALLVDNPQAVATKILKHSEALGGLSRFTFQMDAGLSHQKLMKAIELIGTKVSPLVKSAK
jgi:alkanesulfonate monooxygenase SsuD/methylene tetrahydromethanopterin reductase-like flavin-dependent oxidoreductase (luciferase family)